MFAIMKGGRARWKVENETFNTLKNQGYNLGGCPIMAFAQTLRIFRKIMLAGKRRLRYCVYGCAYFAKTSRL